MDIVLKNVTKKFNDLPVVQNLSFKIQEGEVLGLLGPNGAGKTTTLRMLLDILRPDEGSITFGGEKINKHIRNRIGYLPEERGIYQKYKVLDVLIYFGRLKNLSKRKSHVEAVRLLDHFQMIDYLEEPVSHLSKGIQQKLQFLVSIIHNPQIIILDEPFWGLDPLNQEMLRNQIKSFKERGKVVLLSTHQLNEAETLCDYFVLIDHGKTVLQGTLDRIRKGFREQIIIIEAKNNLNKLRDIANIKKITIENSRATLHIDESAPVNKILQQIINTVKVTKISLNRPDLNDIFLQIIKKTSKAEG